MKINLSKAIGTFFALFMIMGSPCAAEDAYVSDTLGEIFSDTGDNYEKIAAESGSYLSVDCDVDVYETLRKTYYVCDVTVVDSYSSFHQNRYINVGGIHEVFNENKRVKNGSFSVNPHNYSNGKESYRVNYAIYPTMHFVYVKSDGSWKHSLTTADYRTDEINRWYFFEEDSDSLIRRNTYTSELSDESLRHSAAIDAYDLDDIVIDLPKDCVIELKGGKYDYGTISVKLNLPANATELYNRVKGPTPVAVWIFAGLLFVCAVGFLPLVIDKIRRRKYSHGEYARFTYTPGDGEGGSDSGE